MKYGTWTVSSYQPADQRKLSDAGFSPITAAVLCSRGYCDAQSAREFLSCQAPLSSPFDLVDMDKAASRVRRALARREHIAVFGDYDVDGITATCLLVSYLRSRGGHVTSYIPARLEEGYGLNPLAIESLRMQGVELIITVDCGITANDEAELCRERGMELVITDHHECKTELPHAVALVDPHRRDQPRPVPELSGVGVAFKLAAAIEGEQEKLLDTYCDLLCLGIVADVMPLVGENRTMVARGLRELANPRRVGIAALMAECSVQSGQLTAGTIGYTLAPRINAAGRMGAVELAAELFLTNDASRAVELASKLCRLNRRRQEIEGEIYQSAVAMLPEGELPEAIVLADESWHQGVVGIVASRLAEEYSCPTFLICLDGDKGKASSRSYGGFNLFRSLEELAPLLESYGGHELAAGFTIRRSCIAPFREQMQKLCGQFRQTEACSADLKIDCELPAELLTIENIEAMDELEPCGAGCPRPVFQMKNLRVTELSEVGGGKHLRLRLSDGRHVWSAIFFSTNAQRAAVALGDGVEIAYTPQINEYRGMRSVQLNLVDIRPDASFRSRMKLQKALYTRHASGEPLACEEAAELLPDRRAFAAVWRYLASAAESGTVCEDFGCLCRKLARHSGMQLHEGTVRVCLDVLQEQGLLRVEQRPKVLRIRLCAGDRKADLSRSRILMRLKEEKEGI